MVDTQQTAANGPAERLLDAADRLFYQQGYAATGINELIQQAEVARASFYHHFPTKNHLIVAYLRRRHERWMAGLRSEVDRWSDPSRRLLAVFDYLGHWLRSNNFRGCAFINTIPEVTDPDSTPRKVVHQHKQELRDVLAELAADAGISRSADEVLLLLEGAIVQATVTADVWPVDTARRWLEGRLSATGGTETPRPSHSKD